MKMRIDIALLLLMGLGGAGCATNDTFTLRDQLGHAWTNEIVTFPMNQTQVARAQAGKALAGPDGVPVPYQTVDRQGKPCLAFTASLNAFESRDYHFTDAPAPKTDTLRVVNAADGITLDNGQIAVKLAKELSSGNGPIAAVRLRSGTWACGSALASDQPVTGYTVEVTASGPVFAEAVCQVKLGDASNWTLRVRVPAADPVVLIDEDSRVLGTGTSFRLDLDACFAPDSIFYRSGIFSGPAGKNQIGKIAAGEVFRLEPWLRWWESDRQGPCCTFYQEGGTDMLALGAREASAWVDPQTPEKMRPLPRISIKKDEGGLHADFPLMRNARKWMLMAPEKEPNLAVLNDVKSLCISPPVYRLLIKHGHFPLDLIKDYDLTPPADKRGYPRLFMTKADVAKFRTRKDLDTFTSRIPALLSGKSMDGAIGAYLASGDARLGRKLADDAVRCMQEEVNMFLDQPRGPYGGGPTQHGGIIPAVTTADVVMDDGLLTAETRERLLAQAAFLGYAMKRADFWDSKRGYSGHANMTSSMDGYKLIVACFLGDHPQAKVWAKDTLIDLCEQVVTWSDANGGMSEAPHYAMLSFDYFLAAWLMAHNAGYDSGLDEQRIKAIAAWFAKISTPPDSRIGGFRHLPPIGHTELNEPSGEFGVLAGIWKDRDPEFAAAMQYFYQQHNRYAQPGIGGVYPGLYAYRELLVDPSVPAKAPAWGSELFPETGVVLRNNFPSDRETQLYMIAGRNNYHYDMDSGAITLYGKGRVLADDFGYYGHAPPDDHSVLESVVAANKTTIMRVRQFSSTRSFDYVRGTSEAWTRQIAFVKDPDPLAPNYFVINDELSVPAPATWRLWCTAADVTPNTTGALVTGREDVDMDVISLRPEGAVFTTESKTRRSVSGLFPNWKWGPMDSTQLGVIYSSPKCTGVAVALYPRLKDQPPPEATPLAGGKGVKMRTAAGTDYVFLSTRPFIFKDEDVAFEGTAGMVQVRGQEPVLALGSAGRLTYRGKTITSDDKFSEETGELFPGGDFEDGTLGSFQAEEDGLKFNIFTGDPVTNGSGKHAGKYCLAFSKPEKGRTSFDAHRTFYLDPTHTYRVSVQVHITGPIMVDLGGYASDVKNPNLKTDNGKIWQYRLSKKGPTQDWVTLQVTMGPPGSGADCVFPEGILCTTMHFSATADDPGSVYLDNFSFQDMTLEK